MWQFNFRGFRLNEDVYAQVRARGRGCMCVHAYTCVYRLAAGAGGGARGRA